ncbi:hypothetical protein H4W79_003734 [Nocardiopsis terrae]|uniref:Fibronectin type-III domain-containing protein n=1 Tax=Nocardiopsis terrae TaxID=372655 RepID=A0ABR9HKG3_9ACTN|nr:hypothetical protein [Nocardiopsis terrae]MBE1459520.1 hypothetical protein [Nocardiopsis terrae]
MDGRRVVVTWRPGTRPGERASYRVTRRTGHGATARERPVGEVSGTRVVDEGLAVGSEAVYTVVAVGDGPGTSPAAWSQPVMITPEVADLRVRSDETSVTGSWRTPPEAVRVEVLRAEGGPPRGPGDGVPIAHDGSVFVDTDVLPDTEYHYRVRAVYVTSRGLARNSAGLVRRASPGPVPTAVRDLSVDAVGAGFVASWSAPSRGRVVLFTSERPPPWPPGRSVPADRWAELGSEVPGEVSTGPDGRAEAGLQLPAGTVYVLAATVAGGQAVAGARTRVVAAPPVTGLRAERFDTVVRLSWDWPEHTAAALVSWRDARSSPDARAPNPAAPLDGAGAGTVRGSRLRYEAEGGFEAHTGPGPVVVTVRTAVPSETGESLSTPVSVHVPGRAVLDYQVEAVGLLRRERMVHLSSRDACHMPEVAVVYTSGRVQPHSGERGRVLATFPARPLAAGERVSVRVQPPREPGPAWLMCFPADGGTAVSLRQPPVRELRL